MKKVLLTGATGLIGKYAIQPLLDAGFEVFAARTEEKGKREEERDSNFNWITVDLLNFDEIKSLFETVKPQYLLHFAWDTTPGTYLESDLNLKWLESSLEMLKQFKINGGERAVFAGTCFEYQFQDEPINELSAKFNPTTKYARCKNQLREEATEFCVQNDISFGWGRIFYVFGEGENEGRLVPKVIKFLKEDKSMEFSVGYLIKDYMFAGDIAGGFVKFLDSDVTGCVNICTSNPVSIKELVSLIAEKLGKEHLVKFDDKETAEAKIIVGDNTRLREEVGYTPKYTLDSALEVMIK